MRKTLFVYMSKPPVASKSYFEIGFRIRLPFDFSVCRTFCFSVIKNVSLWKNITNFAVEFRTSDENACVRFCSNWEGMKSCLQGFWIPLIAATIFIVTESRINSLDSDVLVILKLKFNRILWCGSGLTVRKAWPS